MATVRAGGRLHVGFTNLSLAHERIYGGIGVALEEPAVEVTAEPADAVRVETGRVDTDAGGPAGPGHRTDDDLAREYAERSVDLLGVPGAAVAVRESLPRHVGLGSGTQLALSIYAAIARAHDLPVEVREAAPALGRGGRSGVGVAGFERGGFLVDGGHPTARFTTDRPDRGEWTVPPVLARYDLPEDWRFVLVLPELTRGRSGEEEDASIRSVVERASPEVADEVAATVVRRLLPAAATGDRSAFGAAIATIERCNGAWYADEQGGVFRPPAGTIVEVLAGSPAVEAAGQSSWGPAVYGLTGVDDAEAARAAGRSALDAAGVDGTVRIVSPASEGATVEGEPLAVGGESAGGEVPGTDGGAGLGGSFGVE